MASQLLWQWKTALYRLFRAHVPPFSTIYRAEMRALQGWLGSVSRTGLWLDVGCGEGALFERVSWKGNRIGVDRVKPLLLGQRGQSGASWVCATAEALPLRAGCADLVTAVGLAEYVCNRRELWNELSRLLRPGAKAIVTAARPGPLNLLRWLLGHPIRTVAQETVRKELQNAGFRLLEAHSTLLQWQFFLEKSERS